MKILLSWLKDYIQIDETPEKISDALMMAGLEVEEIIQPGKKLQKVIVGEILTKEKHANADKLSLCRVNVGNKEPLQIVCGASNMKPGDKVPVALVGAKLPSGFEISPAKIRGIESFGMMCSKTELGLSQQSSGLLILDPQTTIGEDIVKVLGMDDVVFDISITPNRGDALSHLGIARELSAIFNLPLLRGELENISGTENINDLIDIEITDDFLCPRYGARIVKNITVKESPHWLADRLEKIGIRAINNIVDITNYIMLDIGHPMHAFDYDKLVEKKIMVRPANNGEKIITLDEQELKLSTSNIVVADADKPVALAGVMGGLSTSVTNETKNVLFEAASFEPTSVRKTSKSFALMSESSYRFERGTNIDNVPIALNKATKLAVQLAGGNAVMGICDAYPKPTILHQIRLRAKRVNKVIGINLTPAQIETYLLRLKLEVKRNGEDLIVSVPPYRHDLEIEEDLIEEVARMYGYNNIPETLPAITSVLKLPTRLQKLEKTVRAHLISLGLYEIMTYSFIPQSIDASLHEKKPLKLRNPLSEDQALMRTNLKWGMLDAIKRNVLNDEYSLKLFELGKVFHPTAGDLAEEHTRLCLGFCGVSEPENWKTANKTFDIFDLKGIVTGIGNMFNQKLRFVAGSCLLFHPTMQMEVICGKTTIGSFGQIHPNFLDNKKLPKSIFIIELDLGLLAEMKYKIPRMTKIPDLPPIRRDLALLAPIDVPHRDIIKIINSEGKKLLEECHLFDVYQGKGIEKGYRSLAYSMTFRDPKKTLKDDQIQPIIDAIINKLEKTKNVKLR